MLLGHLAVPALLKHYLQEDTVPLFLGSLFPDLVDKSLHKMDVAPSGRTIAHTLLSLAASTLLVKRLAGEKKARSWALGYLGHLACDLGGQLPWFYPFVAYEFRSGSRSYWQRVKRALAHMSLVEVGLIVWALGVITQTWVGSQRN